MFQVFNYDGYGREITVLTKTVPDTTSHLLVKNAEPQDSGEYECNPSNGEKAVVTLHVLNGKSFSHTFNTRTTKKDKEKPKQTL